MLAFLLVASALAQAETPVDAGADASLDAGVVVAEAPPPDAGADEPDPRLQTVVTGSRAERKAADAVVATEVITRTQIEALGARDLGALLQQHPGIDTVYSFRGTGIRLQGLDPEYVLILIDGERVSGRVGNTIDLSRYSLRDVERVEIVKGPASALYGSDAIGGVINLITRRIQQPVEAGARASIGTRLDIDTRGHAGAKLGPVELRLGGGYRQAQPYDLNPADAATSGAGFKRYDGDAALVVTPSSRVTVIGKAAYLRRDEDAVDVSDTGATFDRRGRQEQFDASLKAVWQAGDSTRLSARVRQSLFRDQLLQDQRGARFLDSYTQNVSRLWEASLQLDQQLGDHALTAALDGLSELISSPRLSTGNGQRLRISGMVQDEWAVLPKGARPTLTIAPGIRFDVDSQFGTAPSPRLAVKLDPSPEWTIRGSFGMGFRAPTFTELYLLFENTAVGYVVEGNPALKPETSVSGNLGVDWRPLDGWVVSGSLFHTSLTNLVDINTNDQPDPDNPAKFRYGNVASASTQGAELSVRAKLSRGAFIDVGYMGLATKNNVTGRMLEGRAPHRGTLQLGAKYRPFGLELAARASLVGARPFYVDDDLDGATELVWARPYVDLEVNLTYTFREWLKVFVNGYNLLNSGDARFLTRPPIGVFGGVQLQY